MVQMFGFITETMELYFQNRLLDIAHSRVSRPLIRKHGKQYHNAMEISVDDTDDCNTFRASGVLYNQLPFAHNSGKFRHSRKNTNLSKHNLSLNISKMQESGDAVYISIEFCGV